MGLKDRWHGEELQRERETGQGITPQLLSNGQLILLYSEIGNAEERPHLGANMIVHIGV